LAAEARFKFLVIPPAIVAPERDTPGKRANTWKKPIHQALSQEMSFIVQDLLPIASAKISKAEVKRRKYPVAVALVNVISM